MTTIFWPRFLQIFLHRKLCDILNFGRNLSSRFWPCSYIFLLKKVDTLWTFNVFVESLSMSWDLCCRHFIARFAHAVEQSYSLLHCCTVLYNRPIGILTGGISHRVTTAVFFTQLSSHVSLGVVWLSHAIQLRHVHRWRKIKNIFFLCLRTVNYNFTWERRT